MKEIENIIDSKFEGISTSLKEIIDVTDDIKDLLKETDRHLDNIDKSDALYICCNLNLIFNSLFSL